MEKLRLHFVLIFLLILFTGCSKNLTVTGHVTFSDGKPVDFGSVVFETDKDSFSAKLNSEGFYSIGDTRDGAGIPSGKYTVWLSGTVLSEDIPIKGGDGAINSKDTERVLAKYTLPTTSDLRFEVKRSGERTFDFKVEYPSGKR